MPSTAQPKASRRRRDEVRATILRRALELAEDRPYADLTVEEISRAAGISRSAFYTHFRDKEDLLLAAVEEVADDLYEMAERWWHGEAGESPAQLVRNALTGVVAVWSSRVSLLRAVIDAHGAEVRERWVGIVQRFVDATAEHLAAERERGLLAEHLDPAGAAEVLVWGAERCCYVCLVRERRQPETVVEQLTSLWMAALYPGVVPAYELRPQN